MEKNRNQTVLVIGVILIAIGILSLLGKVFNFMNWDNLWPLVVIGVGAAFIVGMLLGDKSLGRFAVPGSIIITIGLILLFMNITNRWEAWSYAWALIICGAGAGTLINGYWTDQPDLRKQGLSTIRSGLILFLIFGVIMEFIFSVTGVSGWGNYLLWAILLAVMGLFLLVTRVLRVGKVDSGRIDLFWPILMIGVGVVASLAYLGWLPKDNLWVVVNLWPLLLIVAGIGILFRGRTPWVGAILGVLVVVAIFVTAFAGQQLGLKAVPSWPFDNSSFQIGNFSGERITGSGNVITENRPVGSFNRVRMEIYGTLEIQQGTAESLTITGEDNILPLLVTDVQSGELVIKFRPNTSIITIRPVQISLTVVNLAELDNSSSGKVTVGPIKTDDFQVTSSSSGNIGIEQIQADKITAVLSSSGNITIKGSANELDLRVSSSGSFQGGDLQVQKAGVRLSSSGNATVWVIENLSANISSSGNVNYYGNPSVNQSTTSSGRLIFKGEK